MGQGAIDIKLGQNLPELPPGEFGALVSGDDDLDGAEVGFEAGGADGSVRGGADGRLDAPAGLLEAGVDEVVGEGFAEVGEGEDEMGGERGGWGSEVGGVVEVEVEGSGWGLG